VRACGQLVRTRKLVVYICATLRETRKSRAYHGNVRLSLHDLARLAGTAIVITLAWICVGAFFGWQVHTIIVTRGQQDDLQTRLLGMGYAVFAWALLTPLVLWVGDLLPLRRPFLTRNTLLLAVFTVAVAFLRALVDGWLPILVDASAMTFLDYSASVVALFHTHLLFALVLIVVANFLRLEREEKERRDADTCLEAHLAEARLRQLSADLHPHFLFNALNAVAALLHRDPAAAEEMLGKLRELLRASVASEEAREVRLADELLFLERYFDIQKMRFGEKLSTAIHVSDPELRNAAVPPLLLQPLVENSIVHGITRRRDGGSVVVRVDSEPGADGEWLCLQVRDNGPGCEPESIFARGNVGVPNAVARLASIYGDRQSLKYSRRGDAFVAEVKIPLRMVS
jgi:two-component system, LytTR family, sensor kinase